MFEIFIALFGGLFYAGKLVSEKLQRIESDREFNERQKLDESINNEIVASPELREEVRNRLFNLYGKTTEYIDEIYDELEDDFKFVFGDDVNIREKMWLITVNKNAGKALYDCPNRIYYWAYNLLLSHKGKIDDNVAYFGGLELGGKDTLDRDIRFCQRIEQNLNNNGALIKFYFEPKYSLYTKTYDQNPCCQQLIMEHQVHNKNRSKRLW